MTTATSCSDGQCASARMPASLRSMAEPSPGHTRSLGHFNLGRKPATSSTASDAASAIAIELSPATRAGGRTSTESSNDAPAGATHDRPARPRPAVW